MEKKTTISEGMSFAYLIPGATLIVLGIVGSQLYLPLVASILPGLALCLSSTGVDINMESKKYRKYIGFVLFKIGTWHSLDSYTALELIHSTQQYTKKTFLQSISAGGGKTVTIKTFDVCLSDSDGHKTEVNDFDKYEDAVKCLRVLQKVTKIEPVDHYAIHTARLWERKKFRRR